MDICVYIYILKLYVYMCGVLIRPVVLAESWYPHTCTHTHWHICIYLYIYKLNTHTAQGLGAVLASCYGWDHQLGLSCHGVEWEKSWRWMHAINVIPRYRLQSKLEHLLVIGNFTPSKPKWSYVGRVKSHQPNTLWVLPQWSLVTVLVASSKIQ